MSAAAAFDSCQTSITVTECFAFLCSFQLVFTPVHCFVFCNCNCNSYSMDIDAVSQPSANGEENASVAESVDDTNTPSPEYLQQKLYFLLEHLKKMHSALPE